MIHRYFMLLRRELWEHRSLYVVPVTIAMLILGAIAIFLLTSGFIRGVGIEQLVTGLEATGGYGAATGVGALLMAPLAFLNIGLIFTIFFYCLDALYAERKDRSILFWRSLPLTDTETVVSKLVVAAIVAPLIAFAVLALTQIAILILATVFVWAGNGDAWELIWKPVPLLRTWALGSYGFMAGGLWGLPFMAWLLLCSAYVGKSKFLWALLPFAVIPMLERLAFGSGYFISVVGGHLLRFHSVSFRIGDGNDVRFIGRDGLDPDGPLFDPAAIIDPGTLLLSGELWLGMLIAAGLAGLAIFVRRYRPEVEA